MINEFIIEGLKVALSKGDSLKRAMESFYNAGYDPKEVEESARNLNIPAETQSSSESPVVNASLSQLPIQINEPNLNQAEIPQPRVSNYEQPQENPKKKMILIIIGAMIFLLCVLAGLFFFMM